MRLTEWPHGRSPIPPNAVTSRNLLKKRDSEMHERARKKTRKYGGPPESLEQRNVPVELMTKNCHYTLRKKFTKRGK